MTLPDIVAVVLSATIFAVVWVGVAISIVDKNTRGLRRQLREQRRSMTEEINRAFIVRDQRILKLEKTLYGNQTDEC